MVKEFEIQGRICNLPPEMTEEEFWHKMIGFIEENGWSFGGGLEKEKISGCVSQILLDVTFDKFLAIFHNFIASNKWIFNGEISVVSIDLDDFLYHELMEKKSVGALICLIDVEHEVEFSIDGKSYVISPHQSSKAVSLWVDKKEQKFDNISEILEYTMIDKSPLLSVWEKIKIETVLS